MDDILSGDDDLTNKITIKTLVERLASKYSSFTKKFDLSETFKVP